MVDDRCSDVALVSAQVQSRRTQACFTDHAMAGDGIAVLTPVKLATVTDLEGSHNIYQSEPIHGRITGFTLRYGELFHNAPVLKGLSGAGVFLPANGLFAGLQVSGPQKSDERDNKSRQPVRTLPKNNNKRL